MDEPHLMADFTYLVGRQQAEVVGWIGDDVAFAARVTRGGRVAETVQADAQHAVRAQCCDEQISVLACLTKLR